MKGPRLEVRKHLEAEQRLRVSILQNKDYEGKDADLALIRRKHRELGYEGVRRALRGGKDKNAAA